MNTIQSQRTHSQLPVPKMIIPFSLLLLLLRNLQRKTLFVSQNGKFNANVWHYLIRLMNVSSDIRSCSTIFETIIHAIIPDVKSGICRWSVCAPERMPGDEAVCALPPCAANVFGFQ